MPDVRAHPLLHLEADGLVRTHRGAVRTTLRWRGAMARAAVDLCDVGDRWRDLRVPIALALIEIYDELEEGELAALVEAMLPIESAELEPLPTLPAVL